MGQSIVKFIIIAVQGGTVAKLNFNKHIVLGNLMSVKAVIDGYIKGLSPFDGIDTSADFLDFINIGKQPGAAK